MVCYDVFNSFTKCMWFYKSFNIEYTKKIVYVFSQIYLTFYTVSFPVKIYVYLQNATFKSPYKLHISTCMHIKITCLVFTLWTWKTFLTGAPNCHLVWVTFSFIFTVVWIFFAFSWKIKYKQKLYKIGKYKKFFSTSIQSV